MRGRSAVVAVLGEGAEELLTQAEQADMIELRLDLLSTSHPLETLKALPGYSQAHHRHRSP